MNIIKIYILGLIMGLTFVACSDDDDNTASYPEIPNSEVTPVTTNNRVIYEVNVRNYSAEGNFAGLQKDLPHLKDLGADILWLMPIHPIGEENREGTKGSPYAVKDYMAINPDFGTAADLKALIAAAHAANMEIWLDWVANHTAWDHVWVKDHLDYYAEKDGKRPYSPEGWNDVVQLDFNNPAMCTAMIEAMKYWVREFDIDGYRCDAATFVPLSFWRDARTQVDAVKKIYWLCEGDDATYMQVFDCDYAWAFNTAMNNFGADNDVNKLIEAYNKLYSNSAYAQKSRMIYLTNHDLNSHEGTEFKRYGNNVLPLTVMYFTLYDMPLIYNGQEIGMNKEMSLFNVDPVQWNPTNSIYLNLFKKLTQLKRTQPALESGPNRVAIERFETTDDKIFAYTKKKGASEVLVILNLSNNPVRFKFTGSVPSGTFYDYLNGGTKEFHNQESVTMLNNGYSVYVK